MLPGWEPHSWSFSPSPAHHPKPCPALSALGTLVPGGGRGWMFKFPATGMAWEPGGHKTDALQPLLVRQRPSAAVTRDPAVKLLEAGTGPGLRLAARGLRGRADTQAAREGECRADAPAWSLRGLGLGGRTSAPAPAAQGNSPTWATSMGRRGLRSTLPVLGCIVLFLEQKGML